MPDDTPEGVETASIHHRVKHVHKQPWFRLTALIAVAVVVLVAALGASFAVGLYRYHLQGKWVDRIVSFLPFPVATANATWIPFKLFNEDRSTLTFYIEHTQTAADASKPTQLDLEKIIINRLVYDAVLHQVATSNNIAVSQADIDAQLNSIAKASGVDIAAIDTTLQRQYGMNTGTFKEKILRPYITFQKLQQKYVADAAADGSAKAKAQDILNQVKEGKKTFAELAQQFSEDSTKSVGGDLGFFGRGQMVKEFEDAAFALPVGGVSGLVRTQFGYHIIKVEEKINDKTQGDQVHARHILIRVKTADDAVQEALLAARVRIFPSDFAWDKQNGWVALRSEVAAKK